MLSLKFFFVYICNSVIFAIEHKKNTYREWGREEERLTQWVQSSQATKSIKRHKRFLLVAYMQSHFFPFIEANTKTHTHSFTWHHLSFPFIYYLLKCSNVSLRFFYLRLVWFVFAHLSKRQFCFIWMMHSLL